MVTVATTYRSNQNCRGKLILLQLFIYLSPSIQCRRRKWLLDRQLGFIGFDMRSSLGDWIRRKLKAGVIAQTAESQKVLDGCGATDAELREQWKMQVKAQTSIRARKS